MTSTIIKNRRVTISSLPLATNPELCDIQVELNETSLRVQVGDNVTGEVIIQAHTAIDSQGIYVGLSYHTEGRGSVDSKVIQEIKIHNGMLQAGTYCFEFSLILADDKTDDVIPLSYEGRYTSIVWAIYTRLDMNWAIDIGSQQKITVVASQLSYVWINNLDENINEVTLVLPIIFVIIFSIMLIIMLSILIFGKDVEWIFYVLTLVPAIVVAIVVFVFIPLIWRERKLGQIQLKIKNYQPSSGKITGELSITPKKKLIIERARISLRLLEGAEKGSGKKITYLYYSKCVDTYKIDTKISLNPFKTETIFFTLILPEDAPLPFKFDHNWLEWGIRVEIKGNQFDFISEKGIEMVPNDNMER